MRQVIGPKTRPASAYKVLLEVRVFLHFLFTHTLAEVCACNMEICAFHLFTRAEFGLVCLKTLLQKVVFTRKAQWSTEKVQKKDIV